jgi:hypothetical protein
MRGILQRSRKQGWTYHGEGYALGVNLNLAPSIPAPRRPARNSNTQLIYVLTSPTTSFPQMAHESPQGHLLRVSYLFYFLHYLFQPSPNLAINVSPPPPGCRTARSAAHATVPFPDGCQEWHQCCRPKPIARQRHRPRCRGLMKKVP